MPKRSHHIVCPACGCCSTVTEADLGFEEFECQRCENWITIPETFDELKACNETNLRESRQASAPTHYRIMLEGEDHSLSCLKNGVPAEWADLVCKGYSVQYTEGQRVFLEPEESLTDLVNMCRDEQY